MADDPDQPVSGEELARNQRSGRRVGPKPVRDDGVVLERSLVVGRPNDVAAA